MLRFAFYSLLLFFALGLLGTAGMLWYVVPQLPPVESLRDVQLQTPLKVYTRDDKLIAEFGEKRRDPVAIEDVPVLMKHAFIAAEDDRFYDHLGVDWMAITRAAIGLLQTREKKQGGSTITMQVARNFFLTPEKTYERKLKEIVLAVIIERELSKEEILELYLNKIFLGHRAYGVGAAARVYYGSTLDDLDLPQIAMIAGLPKAPSRTNPISNPAAARDRRAYVLGRMLERGLIDEERFNHAIAAPLTAQRHGQPVETPAPHLAELVRDYMLDRYGNDAYTSGYKVHTTIRSRLQETATKAIRKGLSDYDRRHGYRGPEDSVELLANAMDEDWSAALLNYQEIGGFFPALVIAQEEQEVIAYTNEYGVVIIGWEGLNWARKYLSQDSRGARPKIAADITNVGDIIRVNWFQPEKTEDAESEGGAVAEGFWRLEQIPQIEGALVSLNPLDGGINALVGGLDYYRSKFNRVTQARRQPGSSFKPFIYSASLQKGFTAASFINDAPIVFDAPGLESAWRPENYSGKYFGPTRLREALTKSRNLVSIRLLRAIGAEYALQYVSRFGFDPKVLPANLSLALGSGELTPMELVRAYAVFANGGYKIDPYFVQRIKSGNGELIYEADPETVCEVCENVALDDDGEPVDIATLIDMDQLPPNKSATRIVDAENAWIINSILQDVIKRGTGRKARVLARKDLAGKTGTTNDQKDAWFSGFNGRVVTTVWVGFDKVAPLGKRETGARAALPAWIDYMRVALENVPESQMVRPPGLITVRIDPDTGLLAGANHPNAIFESFREGSVPAPGEGLGMDRGKQATQRDTIPEHLF